MSILTQLITVSAQHQPVTVPDLELSFYRAMPMRVRLAVTDGTGLSDMTAFSSVAVLIKSDRVDAADTLMAKTTSDLAEVTQTQVDAGTHESAAVEFTAAECNLDMTGKSRNLWLVVKGTLSDGQEVILGAGKAIIYESAASAEQPPENADPALSLAAAEALFLSTASVQELSEEAQAIARGNLGLEGELLTEDAADLLYAPLSAVSALETAIAGKEPMQTLATELEMQTGTQTAARRMSPALIKAAIDALASGTSLDLPLSLANGGTGAEDAAGARVSLGIIESVPAVAQQTTITISADATLDWNNSGYIDVAEPSGSVRIWFNVDGVGSAPASDLERLIMVAVNSNDPVATVVEILATALVADGAFTVTFSANQVFLTANTPGAVGLSTTSTNTSIGSVNIDLAGANQYLRLLATNGEQITDVDAATLQGQAAAEFAAFNHVHAFSALTTRPRFAASSGDLVSTSTTLANALSASVTAGTWEFEATGFLTTSGATEGASFAINGPAASSIVGHFTIPTNGIGGLINGSVSAWESKITSSAMVASARGRWHISGRFVASASGTFAIRFSAETGGANSATVLAGAILSVNPVG